MATILPVSLFTRSCFRSIVCWSHCRHLDVGSVALSSVPTPVPGLEFQTLLAALGQQLAAFLHSMRAQNRCLSAPLAIEEAGPLSTTTRTCLLYTSDAADDTPC
eukprot:4858365-Amphidinium_carterae.2